MCGKEDSLVEITQYLGKKEQRMSLCPDCMNILGIERVDTRIAPRVGDLFAAVLDPAGVGPRDNQLCSRCGTSFADLRRSGRAGCSSCYDVFKADIDALLRRTGSRIAHRGKLPKSLQQVRSLLIEKPELQQRLESAVQREDYEEAARLRSMIAALDESGEMPSTGEFDE